MNVKANNLKSFERAHRLAAKYSEAAGPKPPFAKKSDARGELYVYEAIGLDWWSGTGVTAKGVAEALAAMKGVKALDIFINSPGGDVFEADAIYTLLRRFDGEKVVHVDGLAASAATLIAMAGDTIITSPVAMWMIHEARAIALGRASDMRAMADLLDKANQTLGETYQRQTGGDLTEILGWMNAETWMTAQEALDRGFTDEISEAEPATDDSAAAASAPSPLVALEARTQDRTRAAKQAHRLNVLKNRAGQPAGPTARNPASR